MAKRSKANAEAVAVLEAPTQDTAEELSPVNDEDSIVLLGIPESTVAFLWHVGLRSIGSLRTYEARTGRKLSESVNLSPQEFDLIDAALAKPPGSTTPEPPAEEAEKTAEEPAIAESAPAIPEPAAVPPPVDPRQNELAAIAEWQAEVKERAKEVQEYHDDYIAKNERTKSAKKVWESAAEELHRFILKSPEPMPLFDKPKSSPPVAESPKEPEAAKSDDEWKSAPIRVLELTKGIEEALAGAGINTIGDLATYSSSNPLTEIKGVGAKASDKIADAMEFYFAERQKAEIARLAKESNTAPDEPAEADEEGEDEGEEEEAETEEADAELAY